MEGGGSKDPRRRRAATRRLPGGAGGAGGARTRARARAWVLGKMLRRPTATSVNATCAQRTELHAPRCPSLWSVADLAEGGREGPARRGGQRRGLRTNTCARGGRGEGGKGRWAGGGGRHLVQHLVGDFVLARPREVRQPRARVLWAHVVPAPTPPRARAPAQLGRRQATHQTTPALMKSILRSGFQRHYFRPPAPPRTARRAGAAGALRPERWRGEGVRRGARGGGRRAGREEMLAGGEGLGVSGQYGRRDETCPVSTGGRGEGGGGAPVGDEGEAARPGVELGAGGAHRVQHAGHGLDACLALQQPRPRREHKRRPRRRALAHAAELPGVDERARRGGLPQQPFRLPRAQRLARALKSPHLQQRLLGPVPVSRVPVALRRDETCPVSTGGRDETRPVSTGGSGGGGSPRPVGAPSAANRARAAAAAATCSVLPAVKWLMGEARGGGGGGGGDWTCVVCR